MVDLEAINLKTVEVNYFFYCYLPLQAINLKTVEVNYFFYCYINFLLDYL